MGRGAGGRGRKAPEASWGERSFLTGSPHSFQPLHDLVVIHDVIGDEFVVDVQKNDTPLKCYSDFIGTGRQLPESQPPMTMRIAEGFANFCDCLGAFHS